MIEKGEVISKLRNIIFEKLWDLEEKDERREDLNTLFSEKAKEISITEEAIKEEINEVWERLEIFQVVKNRERMKSKAE